MSQDERQPQQEKCECGTYEECPVCKMPEIDLGEKKEVPYHTGASNCVKCKHPIPEGYLRCNFCLD